MALSSAARVEIESVDGIHLWGKGIVDAPLDGAFHAEPSRRAVASAAALARHFEVHPHAAADVELRLADPRRMELARRAPVMRPL